jgi:spectinomycin phosphotransferase
VGFGAHHWRVGPLFVTLDALGSRHSAESLEAAYAGAAELDQELDFVVACVRSSFGRCTVPFADGVLSATPWLDGSQPADPAVAVPLVARLHAAAPPPGLPTWGPLVPRSLPDDLAGAVRSAWSGGPHGEAARVLLSDRLTAIEGWTAHYHALAEAARSRQWVATHGEPHERNLLLTDAGPRLVDWESLKLAPAERDLRVLGLPGDPEMLELFDLEWRLDEIAQYASWFAGPHGDTADDRTAVGGLRHELSRP